MACFNRNTQEYKDLLGAFTSNMQVDGIIISWQNVNNSEAFPTVGQAKQFLKDKKVAFSLQQRNFADAILGNLSNKNLISKLGNSYYVNNSNRQSRVFDEQVLQSNKNEIKRYLDINNIPQDAVKFERTKKSFRISINENIFTSKDIIQSSRGWDETRSRHIVVHLMRMFPGIKLKLVSVAEAQAYYDRLDADQKANILFEKVNSYFDPVAGQVVLIKGRVTDETAIEEILHPFVDALFIDNIDLFNNLFNEAKLNFAELNQQINNSYSDKNGFDENYRRLEFVTQALTRHFKKEYEENPTKTFLERIEEFMKWFASIINNLHKYITGKNISTFKRDIDYYQGDQALMEQEEKFDVLDETTPTVKPGVEELFDSNPELANQVYEALGFSTNLSIPEYEVVTRPSKDIGKSKGRSGNFVEITTPDNYRTNMSAYMVQTNNEGKLFITNIEKYNEDSTFKGFGTVAYIDFFENYKNQGITTDTKLTKDGIKLLERLEKIGLVYKTDAKLIDDTQVSKVFDTKIYEYNKPLYEFNLNWKNNQITPQQKQQALQLYSQYLEQNPNGTVEQFKSWVDEFNKNKHLQLASDNNLFNENKTLANAVYEALGFKTKPDVILPIGTSGSGKSTFIKSLPQKDLVVIEPDAMRVEFTGDINNKSKDKEIYEEAAKRAITAIKQGKQVVFDTTNLTKDKRLPFIEAIKKEIPSANIQYKLMELNPELAKQRIKAQITRGENRANVSDSTIDRHAESYKQMLEDIQLEPITNYEITPQQKQQALQLYSQYLDTIFPDSKVKDIVYRGGNLGVNQPQNVEAFTTSKSYAEYRAEQNNTQVYPAVLNIKDSKLVDKKETRTLSLDRDEFQYENYGFTDNKDQTKQVGNFYTVKENNRHILGTKQDIEGFKEFVKPKQTKKVKQKPVVLDISNINPSATLSDIAKLLNTSDIKFDSLATADTKVRFSLTPELQSTVDYALRQSNEIQQKIVKRLFHQAQSIKEEVGSLAAGFQGPIVVLNEENHVYYNLLDTTDTFRSTTERIKGKLSEEDMFNKKLNIDLGNDFDKLLQGLTSDKKLDEVFSQMKVLKREQAEKAYLQLQENLKEITRGGGVAVPQVVVYDQKSKTAGSIDILVILPDGKLRIVDLKTSKNSVKDMVLNEQSKLKYDKEYELGPDSDLKKEGIERLSTRAQQGTQVNIYRRMLENMGYEVDMSEMGASTFHIQVGVKGKDAQQEFTGDFRSDEWIAHPVSQNSPYVNILVPKNVDLISLEDLTKNIDIAADKAVDWDSELKDDEKIPEDTEFSDPYIEYEVITQALMNYRLALLTKLKAIDQIKSSIYMDRTKEQTEENILNALSAINMALAEGPNSSSALFTELLRDALKQIQSFTDYINDPNNFSKPEYITYVLNFNRFIKTFEGLYSVTDLTGINATQKSLILRLQTQLNNLGVSNSTRDGVINDAITNYVKTQIKNWSSRDDLTDDVLNDLMKHARDIGDMELSTGDLSTSRDTILAVMDKIYKVKKQELLDRVETRNRLIAGLSSRLQKLSPDKNTQDLYDFMLEFDDDGEFTGRYVQRLGKQYYKKQQDLRDKLYDENGNPLEYRDVSDAATAKKEDLEFNINLAKLKAAYAAFWSAERLTLDDKLVDGEFHKYTDEFKAIRAKHQYYVSVNGKPIWRRKAGVSDRAYQVYLAKYFNQVEYTYAKKDQNDNFTGAIVRESVFNAVKPQYRVANDYNLRTGERMISDKYEKIMNPTDALGQVQKEFFLAYQEIYENELLKKLPMGYRSQMLGKPPIVKGKLFQDVKNKPNIVGKLWSKATRSINNLISETAEQRGVVIDENGNLVDQLPIFYTGRVRTDAELEAVNNEINALEESKKKGLIKQDDYNREIAILKGRRLTIQARPSKGELSKDMGASLMQFSAMAEHYEVMSTVEDTFKAFIKVLEKRRYQPSDPLITLGTWSKNMFTPKAAKTVLEANVVKRAKKWMAMVYYDNERVTKGFLEKVTDGLISYSSLSYVAFNPFGNFNNYALGRINNSIEALGSRFFSGSAYARAEFEFNKRALPDLIVRLGAVAKKPFNKSDYDPEEPSSKYEALVDLFRMMDNKSEQRENQFGPEPIGKSWFRKATDFGYVLQDAAEYNVQTKVGMAILMDTMIMNKSTGDIISLYDAFEFNSETKKASLKDGYDTIVTLDKKNVDKDGNSKIIKESSYNDNFRYELRNKIREVNKQIHGNYAKDDRMVIESYTLGRLAAQFHKWVAPAIKARFRREYFDENLGWLEGRYRSFWKFLAYTGKQLTSLQLEFGKHQENFLVEYGYTGDGSQQDQRAKDKLFGAYRTLGEIGIIMMTFAISSIFSAMFSDDDDDTEFESRMENFLRYQADRTYKELILFTPLGSQQIYQMFKSPIAATRTLGEFGEALSLSVTTPLAYLIKGEEEFYLDKDYVYQRGVRKGELKLYKNWEDVIPILYSIKKWEDFNNLTNFYIK